MFDTADQGCILSHLLIQMDPTLTWTVKLYSGYKWRNEIFSSFIVFLFPPTNTNSQWSDCLPSNREQPETDSFYGYRCYVTPLQTWHFVNFYSCCDHNPKPKFTGDIKRLVTRWALNLSLDTYASDDGLGASIPNKWAPEEAVVIKLGNKMISILFSPSV